jgi:monoamine oxidase
MTTTRRQFLERVGSTAGATMVYQSMAALGLLPVPVKAAAFQLEGTVPPSPGVRRPGRPDDAVDVLVLGAGLAGLTVAYELGKLGYRTTVLEARSRPGGRCFTVRGGSTSEETDSKQTARFDEGLYFNAGPMRIPHHHEATLHYCRELGVPIEVFIDDNDSAYVYQTKSAALTNTRVRSREVRADMSGYTAELLAKAISRQALNAPLSVGDREALVDYLRFAGALDAQNAYKGSTRRGYDPPPGAFDRPGTISAPVPLHDLLGSKAAIYLQTEYLHQPAMFQVTGGTDRLAQALASKIDTQIVYNAVVSEIRQTSDAVSVVYGHGGGPAQQQTASYVVCTLPLPIVAGLAVADLAAPVKAAIAAVPYANTGKIGLQFKRRFWEEDDEIFGGASRTDLEIAQIVYPSTGFLGSKGILTGYYHTLTRATAMGARTPAAREQAALDQGALIHPQYKKEFESSFSVAWHKVPFSRGGWAQWTPESRKSAYASLVKPDRRVYFAGDHLSYLSGWMAGAFESAQQTATAIHARATQTEAAAAGQ